MIALAAAICAGLATKLAGWQAGLGAILFMITDFSVLRYAPQMMTEAMAFLAGSLFLWSFLSYFALPTFGRAALVGLVLGLCILTRSLHMVWIPFLMAGMFVVGWKWSVKQALLTLARVAVFACALMIVIGPWWMRNCYVLQAFCPTGTQGGHALVAAYRYPLTKRHPPSPPNVD